MCSPQTLPPEMPSDVPPLATEDEDADDEISPLQYARDNGLARDHLTDTLCFSELEKVQRGVPTDLVDDVELRKFDLGNELNVEERVTISKEGALLLKSVIQEHNVESIDAIILPMIHARSETRKAKLELPLLRTDHDTDCKNFATRDGFEIKLQDVKLPLEMVNEEKNEGLVWPPRFATIGAEIFEQLRQEKIRVSKEVMIYLHTTLQNSWTKEDDMGLWNSEQKYKRSTAREPVTPPLSPLPTPFKPYEPSLSDPEYQLPILSDASSPTKYVLDALEAKLFDQDIPTPLRNSTTNPPPGSSSDTYVGDGMLTLGEVYSPLASLENTPPSIEVQRTKREDLKVEEPLTPDNPVPITKIVHFSDFVEEMEPYPESTLNSPGYEHKFFEEAFGSAHKIATQRSEQERLIEADSTARVNVPIMDFSRPDPPWKAFKKKRGSTSVLPLQKWLIQEIIGPQKSWTGAKNVVTKLNWVPFPSNLGKVALEEPVEDKDSTWEAFVTNASEGEVLDSSNLTWKPPGLRILREDDQDEDEIEPGKFKKGDVKDFSALIKKRKMELDRNEGQDNEILNVRTKKSTGPVTHDQTKPNDFMTAKQMMDGDQSQEQGLGLLGGHFSAANSIDNYLELRGTKKPKLMDSSYFQPDPKIQPPSKSGVPPENPKTQTTIQLPIRKSPVARKEPLPNPNIQSPSTKTNLIVSSTLLKHRSLIKSLEALLPGLVLVERDFTAHNSTSWMPGTVTRSPIKSPLDSETDIIVSPSMGIVITTLQKVKQKPLPGQKTKSAIRERLEQVSTRYEKLAVYVSEGRADETTNGLDGNDCLAFSSFAGYTLGLNSSNTVQFVGGGEETLSKWLASTIAENRVAGDSDLLHEETHWELFLRRAGMNAFAAQAIISELKAPDGVDPASPTKAGLFGLAAFIDMAAEQRIVRFSPLCGRGLLERVSAVIDTNWR